MANDTQASYAKIGFFILLGIALIVGTLVYFVGLRPKDDVLDVETFFSESVSGLDVGSAVNLRGVRVGEVRSISFIAAEYENVAREDHLKICVGLRLDASKFRFKGDARTPEQVLKDMIAFHGEHSDRQGLHATVSSSGVTGLSHIELNFPRIPLAQEEPHPWESRTLLIPPAPSLLQSAADSARNILDQLGKMNLVAAWTNIVDVTRNASVALENLNATMLSVRGEIPELVGSVRDAATSVRMFLDNADRNPGSLVLPCFGPKALDETK